MKLSIIFLLFLTGCGFSYSFNPRGQSETFTKQEIAQALKQRDDALMGLTEAVKALQEKDAKGAEKKK